LHWSEGLAIKAIVRVLGVSRNTVRAALASEARRSMSGAEGLDCGCGKAADRELLQVYPQMPAMVIAERIGWARSIRVLSSRVARLRPVYLPPAPASRTSYVVGEIAQCGWWFPPILLPVGAMRHRTPLRPLSPRTRAIVSCYDRMCGGSVHRQDPREAPGGAQCSPRRPRRC
jgi:hypothetical protein